MRKIISYTGNEIYVGHFQGNAMTKQIQIVEEVAKRVIKISPRIRVITAYSEKEKAILGLQLEQSNIEYTNGYKEENDGWSNVKKIGYYVEALEKTSSEYALLLDAYDVLIFKDLDERFIEKFAETNKKVMYNATKNNYPKCEIDYVENREELGEFKYLNAGVVFGKTEDLLNLYKEILETTKEQRIMNPWKSEQLHVRMVVNGKEEVGFDYECKLFQTFSKTSKMEYGSTVIVI